MAKDPDHLATENTGGLLTGLLAEEDAFDRRSLWRLGSWGVASVGAVIIAVLANQSSIGWRREQVAAADLARQSQQIQSVAKESQNETRRLASAIDTLNSDRDRLYSRVTVLEQGLDSVTGAIARQKSAATAAQAVAVSAPQAVATAAPQAVWAKSQPGPAPQNSPPAPVTAPVATTAPAPAPAAAPIVTTAPTPAEKPQAEAKLREQDLATKPPEQAPTTIAFTAQPASNAPAAAATPPLMASKSMIGPPDPAAGKLVEPEKPAKTSATPPKPAAVALVSSSEADTSQAASAKVAVAVQRTEFGVDVGGANSVSGLRALWRGLLKSRSNAALTTLHPIIMIKEGRNGLGMQLRLVAGPLDDAAAAAKICAGLTEGQRTCETTVFDGQRLAMKADEPDAATGPATAKPAMARPVAHRRSFAKRVVHDEPPKPPEPPPSGLSALFGRR